MISQINAHIDNYYQKDIAPHPSNIIFLTCDAFGVLPPVSILSPEQANSLPSMKALAGVSGELEVVLPIEGLIDIASLRSRLEKDLNKAQKEIESLSGRLANKNFVDKAPKDVVEECRANLTESEAQVRLVKERLMGLD